MLLMLMKGADGDGSTHNIRHNVQMDFPDGLGTDNLVAGYIAGTLSVCQSVIIANELIRNLYYHLEDGVRRNRGFNRREGE